MLRIMFLVLALSLISQGAADETCYNPVVNVYTSPNVKTHTELQVDQVAELVRNVSESLLNEYENRLNALLDRIEYKTCACNTSKELRRDCEDIQQLGFGTGIYEIYPDGITAKRVRCDMDTESGGWTVIQKRVSASDFYKTWEEYRDGFGDLENNFWLGNDLIHMIASEGSYELRIDMSNNQNEKRYAKYGLFKVADINDKFRLTVGSYTGDAGDSLSEHNGQYFSTWDADNDNWPSNCAISFSGAWWYNSCHYSNLNGKYGDTEFGKGINWFAWEGYTSSLKSVDIKIRKSRN